MWPDQSGIVEHAVDAGRADRDNISIEHHEGKPTVAFQGMPGVEVEDGFFLLAWMPTEGKLANKWAGSGWKTSVKFSTLSIGLAIRRQE